MKKYIIILISVLIIIFAMFYLLIRKDNSKVPEIVNNLESHLQITKENKPEATSAMSEELKLSIIERDKDNKIGKFIQIDKIHSAEGGVTVKRLKDNFEIKFSENFVSTNGPDLYVYLSEAQDFKNIAVGGTDTAKTLDIGKLRKLKGEQTYLVSEKDFAKYNSAIIIWCKQFGIQFSRADLNLENI